MISIPKVCIILTGLPASGKSTFRKALLAEHTRIAQEALPVWTGHSSDDHIEAAAKFRQQTYSEVFLDNIKSAEDFFFIHLKQAAKFEDEVIIVDRTNMTIKSRRRIMDVIKNVDGDYKFWCFNFTCRTADWDKRLKNRPDKQIPEIVLKRMMDSWEEPTTEEGFVYIKNIDTSKEVDIEKWHRVVEFLL